MIDEFLMTIAGGWGERAPGDGISGCRQSWHLAAEPFAVETVTVRIVYKYKIA